VRSPPASPRAAWAASAPPTVRVLANRLMTRYPCSFIAREPSPVATRRDPARLAHGGCRPRPASPSSRRTPPAGTATPAISWDMYLTYA
jgi:hypothetical protein